MCAKWERMWDSPDSQEVGLEAAILERVRNSSLVDAIPRRKCNGAKAHHRSRGLFCLWAEQG